MIFYGIEDMTTKRKILKLNSGKKDVKVQEAKKQVTDADTQNVEVITDSNNNNDTPKKASKKKKFFKSKKKKQVTKGPTPPKSKEQRIKETQAVVESLCEKFPDCFHQSELKPLKIGIIEDLFEAVPREEFTKKALQRALVFYSYRMRYLKALLAQDKRYDLKGEVAGEVTANQKEMALLRLEQMKERQAKKAEEKKQRLAEAKQSEHQGKISREWQS